jgi:ribosome-associated protein
VSGDAVVGGTLRVSPAVRIPLDEVAFRYETSGGAGGQHANRSHTRVELTFDAATSPSLSAAQRERIVSRLGRVVSTGAADSRSQTRNRELALERLRKKLAAALHVDPPRRPTRPTKASVRARLETKQQAGERKLLRRRPTVDD